MMNRNVKKVLTGVILAALIATTVAPAAQADRDRNERGRGKSVYAPGHQKHKKERYVRQRGPERIVRYVHRGPRVVERHYYHRHRDGHPGIAFLGGLILGAVITNAHAAHADHYFYADPYCDARFSSLDAYYAHARYHEHPRVVHVIEISSGHWVDSYAWHRGGWRHYEADRWECGW